MRITSSAYGDQQLMPHKYTCDGDNVSPPLRIEGVPKMAQSLVLIVNDTDSPRGDWAHWLLWNIPVETKLIPENSLPAGAVEGMNDWLQKGYGGPCPSDGQTHKYHFSLYALDTVLSLNTQANKQELYGVIVKHIIAQDELVGIYKRMQE